MNEKDKNLIIRYVVQGEKKLFPKLQEIHLKLPLEDTDLYRLFLMELFKDEETQNFNEYIRIKGLIMKENTMYVKKQTFNKG